MAKTYLEHSRTFGQARTATRHKQLAMPAPDIYKSNEASKSKHHVQRLTPRAEAHLRHSCTFTQAQTATRREQPAASESSIQGSSNAAVPGKDDVQMATPLAIHVMPWMIPQGA